MSADDYDGIFHTYTANIEHLSTGDEILDDLLCELLFDEGFIEEKKIKPFSELNFDKMWRLLPNKKEWTDFAKAMIEYGFTGEISGYYEDYADSIKRLREIYLPTFKDSVALARELVDIDNYLEFDPFEDGYEYTEEQKEVIDDYEGIDAYIDASRLTFAYNIWGNYPNEDDIVRLFKGEWLEDIIDRR